MTDKLSVVLLIAGRFFKIKTRLIESNFGGESQPCRAASPRLPLPQDEISKTTSA